MRLRLEVDLFWLAVTAFCALGFSFYNIINRLLFNGGLFFFTFLGVILCFALGLPSDARKENGVYPD